MRPSRSYVWPPARVIHRVARRLEGLSCIELEKLYTTVWQRYSQTPGKLSRIGDIRLSAVIAIEEHVAFTTVEPNGLRFRTH